MKNIFKQVKYLLIENAVLKQRIHLIEKALEAKSIPVRPLPPLPRNLQEIIDKNDYSFNIVHLSTGYERIKCPACNGSSTGTICAGCKGEGYIFRKIYV